MIPPYYSSYYKYHIETIIRSLNDLTHQFKKYHWKANEIFLEHSFHSILICPTCLCLDASAFLQRENVQSEFSIRFLMLRILKQYNNIILLELNTIMEVANIVHNFS